MKGVPDALVTYSSSEDEGRDVEERPRKKRKLPTLASSLLVPAPVDRPELHQGRRRTAPHVEGQWAAHVYVSLTLETRSPLYRLMDDVFTHAKNIAPTLNNFWPDDNMRKERELHISLSRPIYLWTHQRDAFKRAVKHLSEGFAPFRISFVNFSELVNDERTRTFLVMEVGAGYQELRAMTHALTPTLQVFRQKDFYADARFHASVAWALLDGSSTQTTSSSVADVLGTPCAASDPPEQATSGFLTIPHLPKHLVQELNDRYSVTLSAAKIGAFDVNSVTVKIGKDIHRWLLSGPIS